MNILINCINEAISLINNPNATRGKKECLMNKIDYILLTQYRNNPYVLNSYHQNTSNISKFATLNDYEINNTLYNRICILSRVLYSLNYKTISCNILNLLYNPIINLNSNPILFQKENYSLTFEDFLKVCEYWIKIIEINYNADLKKQSIFISILQKLCKKTPTSYDDIQAEYFHELVDVLKEINDNMKLVDSKENKILALSCDLAIDFLFGNF